MIAEFVSNHPWMTFFIVWFLIEAIFKIIYNLCLSTIALYGLKKGYTVEEINNLTSSKKSKENESKSS